MKAMIPGLLVFGASILAFNGCGRDDSSVSRDVPPTQASRSSGVETGGEKGEAGGSGLAQKDTESSAGGSGSETSTPGSTSPTGSGETGTIGERGADPTKSVKESVFDQTESERNAQSQTAREGDAGKAADQSEKLPESATGDKDGVARSEGGGGAAGERDSSAAGRAEPAERSTAQGGAGGASQEQPESSQDDVRQAQQALKEQGQDPGPINGIMGPQTRRALQEFQEKHGLEQTGTLDAETRQKLNIAGASSGASGSTSTESGGATESIDGGASRSGK